MKAEICVGISCSGKTTYATGKCRKDRSWVNVNRDDLRWSLSGARDWSEYPFGKKTSHIEKIITYTQDGIVRLAAEVGKNVIISDTNLNPKTRSMWIGCCESLGYDVSIKEFPIDLKTANKRDTLRRNGVGSEVLYKQYQQWLKYKGRKTYTPDESLPPAIIVDVDGTIADMAGKRGPFDWAKVGLDSPREEVLHAVDVFCREGYNTVVLSGRDGCCREETEKWLSDNGVYYDHLYMREAGSNRPDTEIKEELFWKHVAPNYNVKAAFDDRRVMIDLWHELGIPTVFNVGNHNLPF